MYDFLSKFILPSYFTKELMYDFLSMFILPNLKLLVLSYNSQLGQQSSFPFLIIIIFFN